MDYESPLVLTFAPDAQALFREWLSQLEARLRGDELAPVMQAHLAKYRSLMPSLALLFSLRSRHIGTNQCLMSALRMAANRFTSE
jgi:hypothetical protein